ncbi:MAG: heavy metal translocating P-type ATPase [Ruminococcus sp.]|nr:heavy metal translocating P-type ATPase [Ruminococcus sp.]
MKFTIKHEIKGRIRVHMHQHRMTYNQADTLLYYLSQCPSVKDAKVYDRSADAAIQYTGKREDIIELLKNFSYEKTEVPEAFLSNSGRELNAVYQEKLVLQVASRAVNQLLVPAPLRTIFITLKGLRYIKEGIKALLHRKIEVSVLDATAIAVSLIRRDFSTVGSVMFLLSIGELLEEWTHKKSVGDLARSMSLNINKVWVSYDGTEVLVPTTDVKAGDHVVVRMGTMIPFDGTVISGDPMVNQCSLTGESLPVHKHAESYVYAGTVVEAGEITLKVAETSGFSRFEKIVTMIEETEKLKSGLESRAEHLADKLVPYTLGGTILTYLLTRNVTKALSVLMVDFSCALKLAMPITVLSAIREANLYNITVKGGKFLETMAEAETIVFDKTGTLTKAQPTVVDIICCSEEYSEEDVLRLAACLEEHFPHSMAKAVVEAAESRGLEHEETHSQVEYIVAHGISTTIGDKKAIIGSSHFVFEDEKTTPPDNIVEIFEGIPRSYSKLYLAIEGKLIGIICIEDPVREDAADVIKALKAAGFKKIVMMTGDGRRTALYVANQLGIDEVYSEVLPADKAKYVEKEKKDGRKVVMIGDGINDSPALSAADVGIAISEGAEIAREIADIVIAEDNLNSIVTLKVLSQALLRRINSNYRNIVVINSALIVLGVMGLIQPTTAALLHNASTLTITLKSWENLLRPENEK